MTGGFNFGLVERNVKMQQEAVDGNGSAPQVRKLKTGTTIVGVVFEGGVVLAADTRATAGDVVADKRCQKIHYMAPNIRCCGAGVAADTEMVTQMVSAELTLSRLESGKQTRVCEPLTKLKRLLYKYQGHIGAHLVLGGVDVEGPFLATVAPHGSTDRLPFVAMGSGSLAAMATLEAGYRDGMDTEQAKTLARDAISAGILNDPFSGTQVDLCVITRTSTTMLLGETLVAERIHPKKPIKFAPGTAPVAREEIVKLATITEVPVDMS